MIFFQVKKYFCIYNSDNSENCKQYFWQVLLKFKTWFFQWYVCAFLAIKMMMECKKGELCIPMWLSPICLSSEHKIVNGGNRSTKYSMIKCKILNTTEQKEDIVIAILFLKSSEDYSSNYNLKTICLVIHCVTISIFSNKL